MSSAINSRPFGWASQLVVHSYVLTYRLPVQSRSRPELSNYQQKPTDYVNCSVHKELPGWLKLKISNKDARKPHTTTTDIVVTWLMSDDAVRRDRAYKTNARTSLRRPGRCAPRIVNGDSVLSLFVFLLLRFVVSYLSIPQLALSEVIGQCKGRFCLWKTCVVNVDKLSFLFSQQSKRTTSNPITTKSVVLGHIFRKFMRYCWTVNAYNGRAINGEW